MLIIFFSLLACACVTALVSQRYALSAVLFIGFIQDPFRKVVSGEPILLIVTVGFVFGALMLKTISREGVSGLTAPFVSWVDYLYKPIFGFLLILSLQFFHSFFRWGSVVVSTIGLVSYIAPFLAIIVGYYAVNKLTDVRQFMKVYILFGMLLAVSVVLSFMGLDLAIFNEVGDGLKIYDQGTVLRSYSGFMRTGEVAAWHLATTACFVMVIYSTSERKHSLLLVLVIVVFLLFVITLTGRRKMLMLVSLFGVFYTIGFFYFRKTLSVTSVIATLSLVVVLWFGISFIFPGGYSENVQNYLARGSSVYDGATARFIELGLRPIEWAFGRAGFFGAGLGVASQGAHFFTASSIAGGAGEGGLGKVMVELGVPGLFVITWLVVAFSRYILRCLSLTAQSFVPAQFLMLGLGFALFLLVNVMTFSVATQVYGDMFILLTLGLASGVVFTLPKLIIQSMSSNRINGVENI